MLLDPKNIYEIYAIYKLRCGNRKLFQIKMDSASWDISGLAKIK